MTVAAHIHHDVAQRWFNSLDQDSRVFFCRVTQMGLLRLLTTEAVMGADEVLTQIEAWDAYDELIDDEQISFVAEPDTIEREFRLLSSRSHSASRGWTDAYLAAFASAENLMLVTFDQGFRGRVKNLHLLSI
jgi:toxin-antitoxin system PIN domain toxin